MGIFQGEAQLKSFTIEPYIMQRLDTPDDISRLCGEAPGPEAQVAEIAHLPGTAAQLIGERMRAMYATLVREPVPGKLLELVRQLENKERSE